MTLNNIQTWIIPFIASVGSAIGIVIFAFSRVAQEREKADREKDAASQTLINILKETAEAEKVKAERLREENQAQKDDFQKQITELKEGHQKQINEIKVEMANLKALYEASERSKQEYLEILQGKNPEQQAFMKLLTDAAKQSNTTIDSSKKYMEDSLKVLGDIHKFMENLNKKAIANEARNKRVDAQNKKN